MTIAQGAVVKRPWLGAGPRRLASKYAVYLIGAVCVALAAGGSMDVFFSQRELRGELVALQRDNAAAAAAKIEEFVRRIEQQIGWITALPPEDKAESLRIEVQRLLRQTPAISHVRLLDAVGRERLFVSRFDIDAIESGADYATSAAVQSTRAGQVFYGPLYYAKETEPYMTIALPPERQSGMTVIAEVNLKSVWDVIAPIKVGASGYAYVVDGTGRLLAHPDVSLALREINLVFLPQVAAALADASRGADGTLAGASYGTSLAGTPVLASYVGVPALGWLVFVEQPTAEIDAPIYAAILRTVGLMLAGLALAVVVSVALARRMVEPIAALQRGAAEIGRGSFEHRLEVRSGDELAMLAGQFNSMAARLQESYADLERKIEARTRELGIANRTKTQFLAAASHDLRQPLHALGLLIAGLRSKTDPVEMRAMVERADAAIEIMAELLDSLLDISKLDAGVVQPSLADFPVSRLLEQLYFDFAPEAADNGIALKIVPSSAVLRSDPTMLGRILMNLVSNAVRYTPRGRILIGCRRRGAALRIEVWDTGIGIAREQQESVFQEFYKVPRAGPKAERGLGLGLSIVRRLSDLLGCRVEIASQPGKGSMFAVTVPIGMAHPAAVRPALVPARVGAALYGRSVLVVDDDALILDAMRRLLEDWGCRLLAAESVEMARTLVASHDPVEAIICDYTLQGAPVGLDLLAELIARSPQQSRGILMTGNTDAELLRRAKAAGYLTLHKPVRPAKLRSVLTHLLTSDSQA